MKSGQHEPLGGGEAAVRYNVLVVLPNLLLEVRQCLQCTFGYPRNLSEFQRLQSLQCLHSQLLVRGEMEGVDCVVPDVVCDDLAAEGNITSPLPSGDTFQVKHHFVRI